MEKRCLLLLIVSLMLMHTGLGAGTVTPATNTFVTNTKQELEACRGKIELIPVRVWNNDETDDEHQFFRYPNDLVIGQDNRLYFLDSGNNRVQVFDLNEKYIRTVGRRGQGPSDLLFPAGIALDNKNNLVVAEQGNRRLQCFDTAGKIVWSFRTIDTPPSALAVTGDNRCILYSPEDSFKTGSLLVVYDTSGNIIRRVGKRGDRVKSISNLESLLFSLDANDNVFVAFYGTPYYIKYAADGRFLMMVAFESPLRGAPTVHPGKSPEVPVVKGIKKEMVTQAIAQGKDGRTFLVVSTRKKVKAEKFFLINNDAGTPQRYAKKIQSENSDRFRLLVFNASGKVVASKQLNVFCDRIAIHNDQLFIIDTFMGMKIYQYRVRLL